MIVFDDVISDMFRNKKRNPIVPELYISFIKLNISLVFITQSYFTGRKTIRLNSTHYFILKIPKKWEVQQIAFNHSSDIGFKYIMNLYKKPYSIVKIDSTLQSYNPFRFRKNLLGRI